MGSSSMLAILAAILISVVYSLCLCILMLSPTGQTLYPNHVLSTAISVCGQLLPHWSMPTDQTGHFFTEVSNEILIYDSAQAGSS